MTSRKVDFDGNYGFQSITSQKAEFGLKIWILVYDQLESWISGENMDFSLWPDGKLNFGVKYGFQSMSSDKVES